ncbi:MAG: hypothetical protein EBU01_01935 [Crocinitomicaceae bacterium]|nr:hypothetical protein [Crocinitomicaceae bacterium]
MSRIAFYVFVMPLSYLPLAVLYLFSNFLSFIFIYIFPYRKKVIEQNIRNSFPQYTDNEVNTLIKKFYRHFTDTLVEGIKNLSISEKQLRKRLIVKNPELMEQLYSQKRNVILVSGHYNNWEWLISAQNFLFKHQAFGIGMPLSNKFWNDKVTQRRERFGMKVVSSSNYKVKFQTFKKKPYAVLTLGDQSPAHSTKSYWMNFLNQQTAVLFGTEFMANEFDFAVVFFIVRKIRRGYYELELKLLTEEPKSLKWGEITEIHTTLLEHEIIQNPAYWLWSHKRWKREIPQDLTELKIHQKKRFESKFRT